ncbi:hypothetical protein F53441_13530 [Fusarium austroafricanum]|uniref:Transmembrane protein n=1 Tax=Fusarium austroafricanum TaxID=2364996 RepID=A0A8H4NQU7_9HYPO|nr:hypothetical protein F53441_13530 [Fusarium austroafricanum]
MTVILDSPFIEALALMPREEHDNVLEDKDLSYHKTIRIVAAMSALGWLVFGLISGLCINGSGKCGRWIPKWYLDSSGNKKAKLAVAGWWTCVILLWPIIWVVYLITGAGRAIRSLFLRCMKRRKSEDEVEVVVV